MDSTSASRTLPLREEPLPLEFPGVHHMDQEEVDAAAAVLRSKSLFRFYGVDLQQQVEHFEEEFRAFVGVKHALAVSSGSGALHVALSALGAGPGQEVIIPAYLWVAVAAAVVHHGAIPVIADIDDSFCLDPRDVERRITPNTAGVILIHMSGAPGDAPRIRELCSRKGIWMLEDCAQCSGGSIAGRSVGTWGDAAIFSFQMNKNMTSGEGGAVVTNDDRLYQRAFAAHDLGYARNDAGRLRFDDPGLCLWGWGTRMDEMRGAVLRVQLRKLPRITGAMRRSKYRIRAALERLGGVQLRRVPDAEGDTGAFLLTTYPDGETARRVSSRMTELGIRTYPQGISNIVMTEWGLHLYYNIASLRGRTSTDPGGFPWSHPANQGLGGEYGKGACPYADSLFERSVVLPIPSCLTERDEDDVIRAFETAVGEL